MSQLLKRLLMTALVSVAFCAPSFAADGEVSDPLEPVNRYIFAFNNGLDIVIIEPLAEAYHWVLPQYAQDRVHHALINLDEPLSSVNNLLQGNVTDSLNGLVRFAINSTFGVAGMYDVTGDQNADKLQSFGDTFAKWGAGPGPYLVLPLIGPSDLRDGIGLVGDYYGDPISISVRNSEGFITQPETTLDIKYGVELLDARSRLLKQIDDLRKNSLDFYAAMRSIYMQRRAAHLGDKGQASADAPDYN